MPVLDVDVASSATTVVVGSSGMAVVAGTSLTLDAGAVSAGTGSSEAMHHTTSL